MRVLALALGEWDGYTWVNICYSGGSQLSSFKDEPQVVPA